MKPLFAALATALIATLALTTGCSTADYTALNSTFAAPAADQGRIYVYRDAVFSPQSKPTVLLNGQDIGPAEAHSFFYVDRPAGRCALALAGENVAPVSFTLAKGGTVYVRINLHSTINNNLTAAAQFYPDVVDTATARREIASCRYAAAK